MPEFVHPPSPITLRAMMQRAARLLAQSLRATPRAAPAARHGFCAEAAAQESRAAAAAEGDSRVMAYALGALGAVPFVALTPEGFARVEQFAKDAGVPLPVRAADAPRLQILYGCTILSFLGAPHWGLALANHGAAGSPLANVVRYGWGVTPSLLAWPVPALPEEPAQKILMNCLAAAFLVDAGFARAGLLPRWYFLHLRVPLTLTACGSLLATALASRAAVPPTPALPPSPAAAPPPRKGWW